MFYDQFSIDYYRSNLLGNEHVNAYSITCSYRILQYLCNFFLRKEHRTRMEYVTRNGIFEILRFEDIIHICILCNLYRKFIIQFKNEYLKWCYKNYQTKIPRKLLKNFTKFYLFTSNRHSILFV